MDLEAAGIAQDPAIHHFESVEFEPTVPHIAGGDHSHTDRRPVRIREPPRWLADYVRDVSPGEDTLRDY